MTPLIWILIWMATFIFPVTIPRSKGSFLGRVIIFGLLGLLFGVIFVGFSTIDAYMILYLIISKGILSVADWIPSSSRGTERHVYSVFAILGIIALVFLIPISIWQTSAASGVNNAQTFDRMLIKEPLGTRVFTNDIQNNMLRLTTEELAKNIALRNAAHFGSVNIGSAHLTIYKDRLVWVVTILPQNLYGDNTIKGLVIVDANNPEADVEIIDRQFSVGENLIYLPPFFTGDIQGNAYWNLATENGYDRATLTLDDKGDWKYVLTVYSVDSWSFTQLPKGVYVYNKFGQVENFYSISNMPAWITQRYGEGWLEYEINCWGQLKRGDTWDVFAGGFLFSPASSNRVTISDDTRWIIDPDTNQIEAIVSVDPMGPVQTMSGVFKAAADGIHYYNVQADNIKSGLQAQNVIGSHLLKPATGTYEEEMPLMYPYNGTYAWFVPINWHITSEEANSEQETIKLAGLAIVDSTNLDHYAVVMTSDYYQGASLVAEAKREFSANTNVANGTNTTVIGVLQDKFSYVNSGNTIFVLTINSTDYKVATQSLDFAVVSRIQHLELNQTVTIAVDGNNQFVGFP